MKGVGSFREAPPRDLKYPELALGLTNLSYLRFYSY
nr:MAG TPA: hypothetical protein [Caudoviricetes sp.]